VALARQTREGLLTVAEAKPMDVPNFSATISHPPPSEPGAPSWPVALLFPLQGQWTESEYLALQRRSRRLVELSDGQIEVIAMPSPFHQRIVGYLYLLLKEWAAAMRSGEVFFAPLPIRLWSGKYRDPDIAFLKPGRISDPHDQPQGADLVMEVVSDSEEDRQRDLHTKRKEYAQAGIAEYWIVDPKTETITVLTLDGTAYRLHGEFPLGTTATSILLPTFAIGVTAVFDAGRGTKTSL
jgi:Uma2 family endonuclease